MNRRTFLRLRRAVVALGGIFDNFRKELKFAVEKLIWHFIILVAVHILLLAIYPHFFSPLNAVWGTLWVLIGIFGLWRGGGRKFDITHIAAAYGNKVAVRVHRFIVGFFAIETLVNICFEIVPIWAAWGIFLWIPISVLSYFMYRYMAGIEINWRWWSTIPLANLCLLFGALYMRWFVGPNPSWTDPQVWYFFGLACIAIAVFMGVKSLGFTALMFTIGIILQIGGADLAKQLQPVEQQTKSSLHAINREQLKQEQANIRQQLKEGKISLESATDQMHAKNLESLRLESKIEVNMDAHGNIRRDWTKPSSSADSSDIMTVIILIILGAGLMASALLSTPVINFFRKGDSNVSSQQH